MTVIVNELEVVVSPPESAAPAERAGPETTAPPPAPGPRELAALLERRAHQALRVFAH
jgi:hypothetical protein